MAARSPTDERLQKLAVSALGTGGRLVYLHEIHDGWWQARCESNREKSAIIVQGCSRSATAHAMADVLAGIERRKIAGMA